MKFHAVIKSNGKTATGIAVPPEIVEGLGAGKQPLVKVTLNSYTYRSAIASMNGGYMVGVNADVREAAGVAAGDELDVDIVVDTEPRITPVPPELQRALDADPVAKQRFAALSNSKKQRLTIPIEKGKTDETRQRNVEKALAILHEGSI